MLWRQALAVTEWAPDAILATPIPWLTDKIEARLDFTARTNPFGGKARPKADTLKADTAAEGRAAEERAARDKAAYEAIVLKAAFTRMLQDQEARGLAQTDDDAR